MNILTIVLLLFYFIILSWKRSLAKSYIFEHISPNNGFWNGKKYCWEEIPLNLSIVEK